MSPPRVRLAALTSGAALALAFPLVAQAPGLPVHASSLPSGLHAAATVGFTGESHWVGEAVTLGGTVGYAWSRVGVTGTVARILGEGEPNDFMSVGLLGSLRILGGGLETPLEVNLLAGAGGFEGPGFEVGPPEGHRDNLHGLAGAGFTLSISTPVVSVRPWLSPRVEWFREYGQGGYSGLTRLAGSAGVDLRFLGGLGVFAIWDKVEGDDQAIGFGVSYRF